jgi:ectoine hydroxylase-related dioxygenase (phytanoyl-CoA dioxygenase family)
MRGCMIEGQEVPDGMVAELPHSNALLDNPAALRERLATDGFIYLKGVLDTSLVAQARAEVFERLIEVGEILPPAAAGIASGSSRRDAVVADRGAFWKSVSEGPHLRALSHGSAMRQLMSMVIGAPARPQDYIFLRSGARGRATGLHFDYPFFTRAHDQVFTVWLPIGDVPVSDGPLVVVEGSNRYRDLIEPMIGFDVARDTSRKATLAQDAVTLARERGARLLTANFAAGDIAVFGMYTLHGSLENHSPINRVRLSCDVRWQPASLPIDERYFGANPAGTTGASYGELVGAKPLTLEWHVR